ncbi:ATP-binding cassette sub-family A member 9 [Manis javanica]|nr:ATP-binding cassette sub-family A member 9 [Manis javanica]
MTQLVLLDYDVNSNNNLDSSNSPYLLIAPPIHVAEYGHQRSPLFFLKLSFCSQHQSADHVALENEIDSNSSSNDSFEPVSPEFQGKEAIRVEY